MRNRPQAPTEAVFSTYAGEGIHFLDSDASPVLIEENSFLNPLGDETHEIVVEDFTNQNPIYNTTIIRNNYFKKVNNGILIRSQLGAEISNNHFDELKFLGASNLNYGIRCENSDQSRVVRNYVDSDAGSNWQTACFQMVSSPSSEVICNITNDGGVPFQFNAQNANTTWFSNFMYGTNATGLVLAHSTFATQGAIGDPAENLWSGTFNHRYHMYHSDGRGYTYFYGNDQVEQPLFVKLTGNAYPFKIILENDFTLDTCVKSLQINTPAGSNGPLAYYPGMSSIRAFQAYSLAQAERRNPLFVGQDSVTQGVLDSLETTPFMEILKSTWGGNGNNLFTSPVSREDSFGHKALEVFNHYFLNHLTAHGLDSLQCLLADGPFAFMYATVQSLNGGGRFVNVPIECGLPNYAPTPSQRQLNTQTIESKSEVTVSPNPSSGIIHVDYSSPVNKSVLFSVSSMDGVILEQGVLKNKSLNLTQYPLGLYILTLNVDGEISRTKVLLAY